MKIKRIKAKAVRCNLCGKKFELWDEEENFCFRHRFGYGSAYDGYLLNLNLCCKCFDRLMDELVPLSQTHVRNACIGQRSGCQNAVGNLRSYKRKLHAGYLYACDNRYAKERFQHRGQLYG